MFTVSNNTKGDAKLKAWLMAAMITIVVLGATMLASGQGGSAQAAALSQSKGQAQTQAKGGQTDNASPDDAAFPIREGFEADNLGGAHFGSEVESCVPGVCGWATNPTYPNTGMHAAWAGGTADMSDQRLVQYGDIEIPADAYAATLSFWHKYNFEATGSNYYDGGVLEIYSSGVGWSQDIDFIEGGYNATVFGGANPLAGRAAWGGTHFTYEHVQVNLMAYAGHNIYIRFREGSDDSTASLGWWIDDIDVTVSSPSPCLPERVWYGSSSYPLSAYSAASAVHNGKIYMFGGQSSSLLASAYKYDPDASTWTPIAPLPLARADASAVSDGTFIYVLGGRGTSLAATNNLWRYDPIADTYTAMIPYNHPTTQQTAVVRNGKIYRIGGFDSQGYSVDTVEGYSISTNTWSNSTNLPKTLGALSAIVYGNDIYVTAGYSYSQSAVESNDKAYRYDAATASWNDGAIADMPSYRDHALSAILNGRWVLAGDAGHDESVIAWDPATNTWSDMLDLPQGAYGSGGGVINNVLYVVAGVGSSGYTTADSWKYGDIPCSVHGPTPSPTPGGPTPTVCALQFSDVPASSTFYSYTRCLACRGIINGYADGTFRPGNDVTRGQIAKIVANAAGFTNVASTMHFADIMYGSTYFDYIERLAVRGIIGGYPCGGPGEPCDQDNTPYFRANSTATRGQLSKIVCLAFDCSGTPSGQTFEDVAPNSTFYAPIEQLYAMGAIGGYQCGGAGEPCGGGNKPYFRPGANVSRGQTAKIVANVFLPNCETP